MTGLTLVAIIISLVASIMCLIAVIVALDNRNYRNAILFAGLFLINVVCLTANIDKYNNPEKYEVHTIKNVTNYQIDSTLTINGVDTTKTYTITYLK